MICYAVCSRIVRGFDAIRYKYELSLEGVKNEENNRYFIASYNVLDLYDLL